MTYETAKRIKIKIIEALRSWAEEHGFETSAMDETEGAYEIFYKLEGEFKEE